MINPVRFIIRPVEISISNNISYRGTEIKLKYEIQGTNQNTGNIHTLLLGEANIPLGKSEEIVIDIIENQEGSDAEGNDTSVTR